MVQPWVTNRSAAAIFSAGNCFAVAGASPEAAPTCSLSCINCEVKCIAVATLDTSKAPSSSLIVRPLSKPQMCFWGVVAWAPI